MDLKQIEYFVRIAELGSFTRASIALDIAQPALSRQVRQLEVELRQNLFVRNGRGAVPTDAGRLMLEHGRGILHQVERAREDLSRLRGTPAGTVALGLPPSLGRLLSVPLTRAFRDQPQWREARLSITDGLSLRLQEALRSGRLDLALLYGPPSSAELEGECIGNEELFAVAPRNRVAPTDIAPPIPLTELARHPLVIPSRPNALRMRLERHMVDANLAPNIAMEVDGVTAILELVSEGVGLAVLPAHAVRNTAQPERFMLHRIGDGLIEQIWMVISARRAHTPALKALMELLRQQVALLRGQ
ncbi:MAG: LysR family transcriptional regulator [Burkholderiaceae bacterium]|jgi:LysR family nitrogen assimilation transcriptional regulator|nr:LysR family transcriptional regulator [Burkholderiaceae bacterium]